MTDPQEEPRAKRFSINGDGHRRVSLDLTDLVKFFVVFAAVIGFGWRILDRIDVFVQGQQDYQLRDRTVQLKRNCILEWPLTHDHQPYDRDYCDRLFTRNDH